MTALALTTVDLGEYAASLNARLQGRKAESILEIAIRELFPGEIALVSSFGAEAAVLLHMVAQIDRATPVLFLDTGKLFDETLRYRDEIAARLKLADLRVLTPDPKALAINDDGGTLWFRDAEACCRIRKVEPLQRGLKPFSAWINGRKRFQAATRKSIPLVEADGARLKFNPLADWGPAKIKAYFQAHDLPRHPLVAQGYPSIGCAPCTHPVAEGEDPRSGRWRGQDKTECGIHVVSAIATPAQADE
ncbi:phosphoadenylyl-sulfate reductase [uncultured Ferrovibrio sp.]|jgi:phosphoadenosine phosphosulfate reductase|uniref:phosphoadenylyl-sulfate reductase n=1 Tax=uncultured Ferrovibrio sp. TaxID=1576913 RepID=UPI00262EE82D|nr:phosphoadenylyl-sulfate reductase [uncultured Ferrovibrio sp.]